MTSNLKNTVHDTLDKGISDDLDRAINGVLKDLNRVGDRVHSATDDTLSKMAHGLTGAAHTLAAELRSHTEVLARQVKHDVRANPITTFAALATAALTLTGLVMVVRHQRKH